MYACEGGTAPLFGLRHMWLSEPHATLKYLAVLGDDTRLGRRRVSFTRAGTTITCHLHGRSFVQRYHVTLRHAQLVVTIDLNIVLLTTAKDS